MNKAKKLYKEDRTGLTYEIGPGLIRLRGKRAWIYIAYAQGPAAYHNKLYKNMGRNRFEVL